jgi:hypothetical protein
MTHPRAFVRASDGLSVPLIWLRRISPALTQVSWAKNCISMCRLRSVGLPALTIMIAAMLSTLINVGQFVEDGPQVAGILATAYAYQELCLCVARADQDNPLCSVHDRGTCEAKDFGVH